MSSGAYVALSGLRTRLEQLDRLAADIANVGTAGYKAERVPTASAERPRFDRALESAIDVTPVAGHLDFHAGSLASTGRDLDLAIEGSGFFAIETPQGVRYTRNGHFERRSDGTLTTFDGMPVLGADGPITLPKGELTVEPNGAIRAGGVLAGRLQLVDFEDYAALRREGATRFAPGAGITPGTAASARVRGGALEQSNVSMVDRIVQLTEVSRGFEALQRGIGVLMNDVYERAINELGRR